MQSLCRVNDEKGLGEHTSAWVVSFAHSMEGAKIQPETLEELLLGSVSAAPGHTCCLLGLK